MSLTTARLLLPESMQDMNNARVKTTKMCSLEHLESQQVPHAGDFCDSNACRTFRI